MDTPALLQSLIWSGALGLAVGNYATSWIYRMPKNESPFTKHPYCGGCGNMLQPKDLIPGFSYPLLGGKCRYCAMEIPSIYWWTEIFCAIIFMWGVITYGWVEPYMLVVLGGTIAVTLWGLEARTGKIFQSVLLLLAAIGLSYRVLLDASLYSAAYGLIWGAMVPLFWWRATTNKENLNGEKERLKMPVSASLGAVAGVWLAPFGLLLFVPVWIVMSWIYRYLAPRCAKWPATSDVTPFVAALMLLVLNPAWIEGAKEALLATLRGWLL